jgi:hypothetical protein
MSWVSVAVGVVGAGTSIYTGVHQKNLANKEKKNLVRPVEQVPQALLDSQAQAKVNATVGLPSEIYNNNQKNIQRTQIGALKQAQDRRLGGSVVPAIQDNTNNANLALDAADAKQRMANVGQLYKINNTVGAMQHQIFQTGAMDEYNRKYQYAMSLLGAGNQNIASGINQGVAAIGGAAANGAFKFNGGGVGKSPYEQAATNTVSAQPIPTSTSRSTADIIKPINNVNPILSPDNYAFANRIKMYQ